MYGLLIPWIITDNEYERGSKRVDVLPWLIENNVVVFADGAGNKYEFNIETGSYGVNPEFRKSIGAEIPEPVLETVRSELFGPFVTGSVRSFWRWPVS